MGYRPRMRTPRTSGRGGETSRHEKTKGRGSKHHYAIGSRMEEKYVATAKEVVEKTLKRLRTLGSQRFGSSPYSEHFDRWVMNVKDVLSEFESSPRIKVDDQFAKENSQILLNVGLALEERRQKEGSLGKIIESQANSKDLLESIKEDYASRTRDIERRKKSEIKRLNSDIESLREELVVVARMKTGLFRGVSREVKEQKETETAQAVNSRQKELELAILNFTLQRERLEDEYERKRQPVIEQIKDSQKRIAVLETDGSLEDRWFACEALVDAVSSLLQRKARRRRRLFY